LRIDNLGSLRRQSLYRCGLKLLKTVSPQQHFSLGGWLFFKILFFWSGILFLGFSSQKKIETGLLLWSLGFFFLLIFFFRNLLAQIKIYPPLFEIQTNTFSPGQFIPFGLSLIARRRLQLKGIHVSLSCEEKSISVVRNNQITYRSTLFEVHQTYFPESLLLPEMEKKLLEKIKIPSEAPYVFSSPHHQLSYRLNLQIEIAYFPDYRLSKIIYVIPPGYHAL
jgi:hypothetical protein